MPFAYGVAAPPRPAPPRPVPPRPALSSLCPRQVRHAARCGTRPGYNCSDQWAEENYGPVPDCGSIAIDVDSLQAQRMRVWGRALAQLRSVGDRVTGDAAPASPAAAGVLELGPNIVAARRTEALLWSVPPRHHRVAPSRQRQLRRCLHPARTPLVVREWTPPRPGVVPLRRGRARCATATGTVFGSDDRLNTCCGGRSSGGVPHAQLDVQLSAGDVQLKLVQAVPFTRGAPRLHCQRDRYSHSPRPRPVAG